MLKRDKRVCSVLLLFVHLPCENAEATVSPARWRSICRHSNVLGESLLQDGSSVIRLPAAGLCRDGANVLSSHGGMDEEAPERERGRKLCTYKSCVDNR